MAWPTPLHQADAHKAAVIGIRLQLTDKQRLAGQRKLGRLVAEPKYIDAFKHGLIETQRTGKPTTGLLDVIKHLGAQEGVKGLLTEPAAPSSDPTLNQRPNIFKRPQSSTASVKPSGLTSE